MAMKRQFEQDSLSLLPVEIILLIFSFLRVDDVWNLRLVSKFFNRLINQPTYWQYKASFLSDTQKKDLSYQGLKKLILNRYFLRENLSKHLLQQKCQKDQNRLIKFFSPKTPKFQINDKLIDLDEVQNALLADDVFKFISSVSKLKELPLLTVNTDIEVFKESLGKLLREGKMVEDDFRFIPILLPLIIQARAFKCFKMSLNFHFLSLQAFRSLWGIFTDLTNIVLSSKDQNFVHDFFSIVIKMTDTRFLGIVIKCIIPFVFETKGTNYLSNIIDSMDCEDLIRLTKQCNFDEGDAFDKIFSELKLKNSQQKAIIENYFAKRTLNTEISRLGRILTNSSNILMFFEKNPKLEYLKNLQEEIHKQFTTVIDLQQRLENIEAEEASDPKNPAESTI